MRLRIVLSLIAIVIITIAIVLIIVFRQTAVEVRAFMFRGGLTGTQNIVNLLEEYYLVHDTWYGVDELLMPMMHNQMVMPGMAGWRRGASDNLFPPQMRLADSNGLLMVDTKNPTASEYLTNEELENAIPLQCEGVTVGYLLPEGNIPFTPANETALLSRLYNVTVISVLIAGGVALILALLLSNRLIRPIQTLTRAATQLATGDLSQRVPAKGKDELAKLGQTFNQMATSLQQAEESRRAMTADVAHELRTPLAVQRANIEALLDGIYPLTPENLLTIQEQNELLSRLVEDLRILAMTDSGQMKLERIPTNLKQLVEQMVNRFTPQIDEKHLQIQLDLSDNCPTLSLDALRIEQILNNLLSNTIHFTPLNGHIRLNLACQPNQAVLTILDSGPGIPEEALPHIFERFYRADKSRSRVDGSTGLGLAIARQMARAHNGELTAANHPDGGAIFTLTLPFSS
ncbi:MAG: ATP-binding protein [Chloroflexota bacterium]